MSDDLIRETVVDEEHLKLLSLGYLISAAMTAFFSLFGLFYMAMAIFVTMSLSHHKGTGTNAGPVPPAFMGSILGSIGLAMFLFTVILAAAKFRTASCIKRRKARTFCLVVAGINCLEFPYGTALSVLTFIVLGRESVTRMFQAGAHSVSVI
jgi:hypothetical protein